MERAENFIKKILKDNSGTIELELICKDGQKIPFEYQVVALDDGNGETKNLFSIGRNITERKKSEYVLKESEEKYRGLFNNMSNGFALHKIVLNENKVPIDYTFIEINEAFENQTGLKKRNIIGKNVTKVLPGIEKDATDWIRIYGKVALTQESIHFENFAEPLNRWYSVSAYCPQKGYFATIFEDITKRKQTEEKLKSRNKELETWAEVATNRELFMLDLKKEINELLEKSGKKPKYKIPI